VISSQWKPQSAVGREKKRHRGINVSPFPLDIGHALINLTLAILLTPRVLPETIII
jgi:hypothetical protein